MKQYKIGVVGTGFIGPVHVEALRRLGMQVAALVDVPLERATERAQQMGIPQAYATLDELLADSSIDVVHITSPNHLHFPHAKAVLEAGKHVICEKPLALSTKESAELVALAKAKGLRNAVNFNLRFYPLVQHARGLVQSGELGDVYIAQGSYLQDWLLFDTDWNWRLEPGQGGDTRAIGDIGSHWLDMLTFITGQKITSVCADFATFLKTRKKPKGPIETFSNKVLTADDYVEQPINTEDYATVMLRFANGSRGVVTASQVSAGRKNRLSYELDCAKSSLAWDSERPNELWIGHRNKANELLLKDPSLLLPQAAQFASYPGGHNEGFPDTFKQLYGEFYRALESDPNAPTLYASFADGHYELQLGEAILQSARESRWVDVATS